MSETLSPPETAGFGQDLDEADNETTRQFVTFHVGEEVFAVPIAEVQEIVRVPEVVRVPLAPANLRGLANLRGQTLPIISLRSIFSYEEQKHTEATRVLVVNRGTLLGFVVDQVSTVVSVEDTSIESVDSIDATINTEFVSGVIKNVGSHAMAIVLDLGRLISSEFRCVQASETRSGGMSPAFRNEAPETENEIDEDGGRLHLVSFAVDGQEYAISIDQVREIVQVPEQIVHVPNSQPHVLGVITLRNKLLPLVSLRQMFGLRVEPLSDRNRIIVINDPTDSGKECSVGIVTDMVNEVLRVDRQTVDDLPALLARDGDMVEITAIGRLDSGKRLVSLLSAENMFRHTAVRAALSLDVDTQTSAEDAVEEEQMDEDEEQVVVFRLGEEEFGVAIAAVHEIVRVPENLARVPRSPAFVEGIINLRGTVLPVVDQRRRFDLEPIARNDRQRIMVLHASGTRTGFIVDCVTEVLRIPRVAVEAAPEIARERAEVIRNVANLPADKRMIMLIDAARLLDTKEAQQIDALAA